MGAHEMKELLEENGVELTNEQVQTIYAHLLYKYDKDGDGMVEKHEFVSLLRDYVQKKVAEAEKEVKKPVFFQDQEEKLLMQIDLNTAAQFTMIFAEILTVFYVEAFFTRESNVAHECLTWCEDYDICCKQPGSIISLPVIVQHISAVIAVNF